MATIVSTPRVATPTAIRIGCAGWSLPASSAELFPGVGSHLERYSGRLNATEINSTFYRSHRPATYARWAESVPNNFAFSVKIPKTMTHESRLVNCGPAFEIFLSEVQHLGAKLKCLLVQLPPSLVFDETIARSFFGLVRAQYDDRLAVEPRHETWFTSEADDLLKSIRAARVAADPDKPARASLPGGDRDMVYYRLHGSPRMYYSPYDESYLQRLATQLSRPAASESWCIFDNTASGAAIHNAVELADMLG